MTNFESALAMGADWKAVVASVGAQLSASESAGDTARDSARDSARDQRGLGIVYATESLAPHFSDIVLTLRARTGVHHWVGCVGMGVCGIGHQGVSGDRAIGEYHDQPALSVLIAPWPESSFHILPSMSSSESVCGAVSDAWAATHGPLFGLVHGDPRNRHIGAIVEALPAAGEGYFVGGLTTLADTPVQVADQPTSGGLSGLLLAADIPVMVTHSQGCSPVGPFHRITASEHSIIASLDGRRALDVLKDDVGEILARDLSRLGGYIHIALPVPGSDTNDYTVRNLVGIDPKGGMIAVGEDVDIGDRIMFVRRDPESAQQDFFTRLTSLKARIGGKPIRGGVFVSCIARGEAMFGEAGREVGLIQDVLGDFPLAGFYANGEICGNRMYGYTGVLSVFL
jgi:small ligand-binding sensory domain FIST